MNVVSIEILQASKRIDNPQAIEYMISQSASRTNMAFL